MFLCKFTEYGSDSGVSMRNYFEKEPYPGKEKIISYLKNNGRMIGVTAKLSKDRITAERIKGEYSIVQYTDGIYEWTSDLAYHVEKYNLRLPKEFEDYVLSQDKKAV